MNHRTASFLTGKKSRTLLLAGPLLLSLLLASHSAMADLDHQPADARDQSAGAPEETKEKLEQRFLDLHRSARLSAGQVLSVAEGLHAGSRTTKISFDVSGAPAYRIRTVRNGSVWENLIDANTGRISEHETEWSLQELDLEERDNIVALKSIQQDLSDALSIAEKIASGKAFGAGLLKEGDRPIFVVVVLDGDHLKEVYLEPPRATGRQSAIGKNR